MGYLHVYTGDGKGKTTCALGLLMRAAGADFKIAFMQFDKGFEGRNEHYHERFILRQLPQVDLFFFGMERMMPDGKFRFQNNDEDFAQARAGLKKAADLISDVKYDMIICDEIITCVGTKLLTEKDLLDLVSDFRAEATNCELILTGRSAFPALIEAADLVTEMKLVKHYFYSHKADARVGIEY